MRGETPHADPDAGLWGADRRDGSGAGHGRTDARPAVAAAMVARLAERAGRRWRDLHAAALVKESCRRARCQSAWGMHAVPCGLPGPEGGRASGWLLTSGSLS